MRLDLRSIRRGIITFWAIWFAIVFATNLCDGLKALAVLPEQWVFASGNFELVRKVTARYGGAEILAPILFVGVVLWEGLASMLFGRAAFSDGGRSRTETHRAFASGLALWAAFVIADELFMAYEMEAPHLRLFTAQLVSLLFVEWQSDGPHPRSIHESVRGDQADTGVAHSDPGSSQY